MRYNRIAIIALLAVFIISGGAFAATNLYKDTYTTEDSSGNWTMSADLTVGDDLTVTGDITGSGVFTSPSKSLVSIIDATADTVGTVTAAKSGYTFITGATDDTTAYVLTLPACANGLTYSFVNATT